MAVGIQERLNQTITAARLFADNFSQAVRLGVERQGIGARIGIAAGQNVKIILSAKSVSGIKFSVQIRVHMIPLRAVVLVQRVEIGEVCFPIGREKAQNSSQSSHTTAAIV